MNRSTTTQPRPAVTPDRATRPFWQMVALLRMETTALRRNWTATLLSGVSPLLIGVLLTSGYGNDPVPGVRRAVSVISLLAVFVVHHHLTTVYASRRQELVLKRLRAGLPSDRTILFGTASCTVLMFLLQAGALVVYTILVLGLPAPKNPLIMLVSLVLGAAVMAGFSALLSAVTRSSEAAMLTTLPSMMILLCTPGALLPIGRMPEPVETLLWLLPTGPFTEILRIGWLGRDDDGQVLSLAETFTASLPSLGVLLVWLVVSLLLARRYFRWEPRH
ncbi:ABC transporter permease [Actinoplanes sp. NPDC049802]|uniref:ABC transporter permease n=1 Tax=Actinoplanes sp. NPDC049802 TaxID=3154742 RepID=UPI0033EF33C9